MPRPLTCTSRVKVLNTKLVVQATAFGSGLVHSMAGRDHLNNSLVLRKPINNETHEIT